MRGAVIGFLLGVVVGGLVLSVELTTDEVFWPLVLSFPLAWTLAGYLFQRWKFFLVCILLSFAGLACVYPLAQIDAPPQPSPTPTAEEKVSYRVTAEYLNIRDEEEVVISGAYYEKGDVLSCVVNERGWCVFDDNTRVWSGCLFPNVLSKECRSR